MRKRIDMTGRRIGLLTVLSISPRSNSKRKYWIVKCSLCGGKKDVLSENIRRAENNKTPRGCGCIHSSHKHGYSKHPAYKTWEGMISRCYNSHHVAYGNYGGRGVTVCDEWMRGPKGFCDWALENGWGVDKQLDRIDNNGNYGPANCRFVDVSTNQNNKRTNRRLVVHGKEMTIAEAVREYGVGFTTIKARLDNGWAPEKAVSRKSHRGPDQWTKGAA